MKIDVTDFVPRENHTLKGFLTVSLSDPNSGLKIEIPGFMLHHKDKNRWIEFPGKQDKNGNWSKTIMIPNKGREILLKAKIMKELDKYLDDLGNKAFERFETI